MMLGARTVYETGPRGPKMSPPSRLWARQGPAGAHLGGGGNGPTRGVRHLGTTDADWNKKKFAPHQLGAVRPQSQT